ncbi:MAG: hypothetical protein CMH54_15535 [Myxococcales bacterium]|mgnify:CR=1 FL=1|nr:hypothetical protein [Myxococcales bacterium]
MFVCPRCNDVLARQKSAIGHYWSCKACNGRHASLATVRKISGLGTRKDLWEQVRNAPANDKLNCPTCPRSMKEVTLAMDGGDLVLDICPSCQFVWFDPGEFEELPQARKEEPPPAESAETIQPVAREVIAAAELQMSLNQVRKNVDRTFRPHEHQLPLGKSLLAFIVPVEGHNPLYSVPVLTWLLSALVAVFGIWMNWGGGLLEMPYTERVIGVSADYGLVPAEAGRYGGLTFLTCFFVHFGWAHLVGNLCFLWMFGDNVEDFLGRRRFLLLLLLATVAGGLAHISMDSSSQVPAVGASGGISGILAFYALRFPRVRLHFRFLALGYARMWFPIWGIFPVWIGYQIFLAKQQAAGLSSVSAAAHLGGVAVGVIFFILWRNRE